MSQPKISVIIRSIDRPVLQDALASVACQTCENVEVVLVDAKGGNHTDYGNKCGPFPLRYCSTGKPLHRSAAANFGLEQARGDYLIFLDDDDWFMPHHLHTLSTELEANQHIYAVYSAVECMKKNDDGVLEKVYLFNQPFDRYRLLVENYLPIHSVMFQRSVATGVCLFDDVLDVYEDWDFWIQLSRLTEFKFINNPGAVYRVDCESGFGIAGDQDRVDNALRIFFNKWRNLWTDDELLKVVEYAKHYSMYWDLDRLTTEEFNRKNDIIEALESNLFQYQQETDIKSQQLQEVKLETDQKIVALQSELFREQQTGKQLKSKTKALSDELKDYQELVTALQISISKYAKDIDKYAKDIEDFKNSTSWRFTAPMRYISGKLRTIKYTARVVYFEAMRLSRQAYQIWVTNGTRVLLSRTRSKMSRYLQSRKYGRQNTINIGLESKVHPIDFSSCTAPQVSIVIPVHNQHIYTFNCLKSLYEHSGDASIEIIVVNDGSSVETTHMLKQVSGIKVINQNVQKGFINSCNEGAKMAAGKFLVFLNNDTVVTESWLEKLINVLERDPEVGIVGPKLLYPDGMLQEAGGIVWRDGSTWNYGRLDAADKPEYNYFREVDYCSGACLAIKKNLFLEVGRFDSDYAPAYFEDVDLAFKVRQAGFKVCYQPKSSVYHFEGISSGKAVTSGLKGFQSINQHKFYNKWKGTLSDHSLNGEAPHLAKDKYSKQRLLVLDKIMLTPDKDSGSLRMFNLLNELVNLKVKVIFATMYLDDLEPYKSMLQEIGVEVLYRPHTAGVEQYLQQHGRELDVVLLSRLDTASFFIDHVKQHAPHAGIIFDTVDLHFLREERMAELHGIDSMLKMAAKTKAKELDLVRIADVSLVVSSFEEQILTRECPHARVRVLSNIHDIYGSKTDFAQRKDMLFIGGFDHPPNIDAAEYLVHELLPLLRQEIEDFKLYIIGSNPTPKVLKLASENVIVTGFVKEISPYFDQVRLSIAPLRYGAGVKGKVNMSMAYGVPVVATSIAVEGMHLKSGHDAIIADTAQGLASGVAQLYSDRQLWEKISSNGLRNLEKYFSKEVARKKLDSILGEVAHR